MPLRMADTSATRKFEDGDAWIVLRVQLTKGEGDRVRDLTASYKINPAEIASATPEQATAIEINNRVAQANRALFETLCDSWSVGDVSGEAYANLDEESGRWVDDCIQEILAERRKRAEGKSRSSAKRARPGSSSAKAAA